MEGQHTETSPVIGNGFVYHTPEIWESAQTDLLSAALLKFHTSFKSVKRDELVVVPGRTSRKFSSLDEIMIETRPLLSAADLFIEQPITGNQIITFIRHKSGQFKAFAMPMVAWQGQGTTPIQNLGGAITYMRRYAIGAALALATEEDDDAANTGKLDQKKQAAPPANPVQQQSTVKAMPQEVIEAWENKIQGLSTSDDFDKCLKEIGEKVGDTPKHPWRVQVKTMLNEASKTKGFIYDTVDKLFVKKNTADETPA